MASSRRIMHVCTGSLPDLLDSFQLAALSAVLHFPLLNHPLAFAASSSTFWSALLMPRMSSSLRCLAYDSVASFASFRFFSASWACLSRVSSGPRIDI